MRAAVQRKPRPDRFGGDQPLHRRSALARTSALPSADRARMLEAAKLSANLYDILGVSRLAGASEIKSAFRRLAKSSHPDFNTGDATAQHRFQLVHLAYRVLCDIEMRADYDRYLLCVGRSDAAQIAPIPRWRRIAGAAMVPVLVIILTPVFVLGFERNALDQVVARVAQWRGAPQSSPPTDLRQREVIRQALPDIVASPLTQAPNDADAAEPPQDLRRRDVVRQALPDIATAPLTPNDADAAPVEPTPAPAAPTLVPDAPRLAPTAPTSSPAAPPPAPADSRLAPTAPPLVPDAPTLAPVAPMPPPAAPTLAAPAAPSVPAASTAAPATADDDSGTLNQARRLLQQGERYAAEGNIVTARQYFVRAADLGLAVAATRMAETFEAALLDRHRVHGLKPDSAEAAEWRRRALELDARQPGRATQGSSR